MGGGGSGMVEVLAIAALLGGEPLLAGPRVEDEQRAGLVERDYRGRVKALEVTAEEAALEALGLAPEVKERALAIFVERAKVLDRLVMENLERLIALGTASAAEDKADQFRLLMELGERFRVLNEGGTLRSRVEAVLPREERGRYGGLVREYRRAMVADARREAGENNKLGAIAAVRFGELGKEIERSFARVQGRIAERYIRDIAERLELTERQRGRLGPIIQELAEAFVREAPEEEIQRLGLRLTAFLTEGQRTALVEVMSGKRPEVMPMGGEGKKGE